MKNRDRVNNTLTVSNNLIMDPAFITDYSVVPDKSDRIVRRFPFSFIKCTSDVHINAVHFRFQQNTPNEPRTPGFHFLIRIQNQNPLFRSIADRLVTVLAEISFPEMMKYAGTIGFCDFHGTIRGTRIHDDNLINMIFGAFQAFRQKRLFIFHDHA